MTTDRAQKEPCTRCGWVLYHLRRGVCRWCEDDATAGGGEVEYSGFAAHVTVETPLSVLYLINRLTNFGCISRPQLVAEPEPAAVRSVHTPYRQFVVG